MKESVYIEVNNVPLQIKQGYKPLFGVFYITRQLYSIVAKYGYLWQRLLFYSLFTFLLTAPALVLDTVCIVAYAGFFVVKRVLIELLNVVKYLFKTIIDKFLGTFLKLFVIVSIIFLLVYKWHETKNLLNDLTDWLYWQF